MTSELSAFNPTEEFTLTESPNPKWTLGQRIESTPEGRAWMEGEKEGWTVVDAAEATTRQLYTVLISGIVPRPVAFVSSISEDGVENLAPFSWFNQVAPNPPMISFSCLTSAKADKDTSRNIKQTKGFTVNIISEPWVEQANAASMDAPAHISEWPITGLTKAPSIHVKAARVKECALSMECELYQAIDIPNLKTNETETVLILGLIKAIHMRNDIVDPVRGGVLAGKLRPVGRMGGLIYNKVSEGYALERLYWKDVSEQVKEDIANAKY